MKERLALKNLLKMIPKPDLLTTDIIEHLPLGIAFYRTEDNSIVFTNDLFCNMSGWPRETLTNIYTLYLKFFPRKSYREMALMIINSDVAGDNTGPISQTGVKIMTMHGETRYVNIRQIPVYERQFVMLTLTDETEETLISQAFTKQEELLREIAFINSHEIRRPIATILGLIPLLKNAQDGNPDAELLEYFEAATKELDTVIKQIIIKTAE
ncbi:MAG TPA: PAS domain S-box protein [Mucilaginibacter sp.]|jgi:PAS domain S-box-containing protein|nr:PAS domain S-box protein [Mucilaginibacter sp.]